MPKAKFFLYNGTIGNNDHQELSTYFDFQREWAVRQREFLILRRIIDSRRCLKKMHKMHQSRTPIEEEEKSASQLRANSTYFNRKSVIIKPQCANYSNFSNI